MTTKIEELKMFEDVYCSGIVFENLQQVFKEQKQETIAEVKKMIDDIFHRVKVLLMFADFKNQTTYNKLKRGINKVEKELNQKLQEMK